MTTIRSLQDICIDYLADTFEQLWTFSEDNQNKTVWHDPGLELPGDVPEKLLYQLCKQRKLNDSTLSLFQPQHACLRHVTIPDAWDIPEQGLKTLKSHCLLSLDICMSLLTVIDVLKCLGSQNLSSLQGLTCKDLKHTTFCHESLSDNSNRIFPRLHNVYCLSLINVGLTDSCLDVIASNVPNLQSLDISQNINITNISPLAKHAERLQVLIMFRLHQLTEVTAVNTLRKLKQLQCLDVSAIDYARGSTGIFGTRSLLMDPSTNPNLTSLDLSGRENVTEEIFGAFLDAHPSLNFLGLLYNEASGYPMFDVKSQQYRPGIKVAGTSNLDQMALSLRRYHKSHMSSYMYVWDTLHYADLSFMTTDNDDIIRAILEVMPDEMWSEDFTIYDTKKCLNGLEKILRCRCVSHIQPDTIRQLLRTCHLVLKQCEALEPHQTTLKEDCLRHTSNINDICEKMETD